MTCAPWYYLSGEQRCKPGEDFEEPVAMLSATFNYVAMANICYTLGLVPDTVLYNGYPGKRLYKIGLILAVVLTALPGVWAVIAWLITVNTG